MARSIQEQIMEDVNNGMTVAILGRTNPSLLPLSVFLDFQDKFNYAIRGTLYDLKRPKFRKYWQLAYLFMNNYEKMHENLKVIAKDLSNYQLKNFVNALKIQGQTIFNFPMNSLRNISEDLASFVIHINSTADDEVEKLKATFEFVKYRALDANDEYTEETVSIIELLEMIIECGDVKTMDDFIYEINYRNTRLHSRADSRDTTIQLTTVHDFKGKEADSVYI